MKYLRLPLAAFAIVAMMFAVLSGSGSAHAASIYAAGNDNPQPPVAATIPSYADPLACLFANLSRADYFYNAGTSAVQIYHSQKVLTVTQQLYNAGYFGDEACAILTFDTSNQN